MMPGLSDMIPVAYAFSAGHLVTWQWGLQVEQSWSKFTVQSAESAKRSTRYYVLAYTDVFKSINLSIISYRFPHYIINKYCYHERY